MVGVEGLEQCGMEIAAQGEGQDAGTRRVAHGSGGGGEAILVVNRDDAWIGGNYTLVRLKHDDVADPDRGPGIVDVRAFQVAYKLIALLQQRVTAGGLDYMFRVALHIGRSLSTQVDKQPTKQEAPRYVCKERPPLRRVLSFRRSARWKSHTRNGQHRADDQGQHQHERGRVMPNSVDTARVKKPTDRAAGNTEDHGGSCAEEEWEASKPTRGKQQWLLLCV